jgi:hypothetical protein
MASTSSKFQYLTKHQRVLQRSLHERTRNRTAGSAYASRIEIHNRQFSLFLSDTSNAAITWPQKISSIIQEFIGGGSGVWQCYAVRIDCAIVKI